MNTEDFLENNEEEIEIRELSNFSKLIYEDEDPTPATEDLSVDSSNFHSILNYVNERLRIFDVTHENVKLNSSEKGHHKILQCLLDLIRLKEVDVEKMETFSGRVSKLQCDKENSRILLMRRKQRLQALTIENNRRKVLLRNAELRARKKYKELEREMKALELLNRKHHQKNMLLDKKVFKLEKTQEEQKDRMLKIVNNDNTDPLSLLKKQKVRKRKRRGNLNRTYNNDNSRSILLRPSSSSDLAFGPPLSGTRKVKRKRGRKGGLEDLEERSPKSGDHKKVEVVNERLWKHGLARNVNNLYRNIVGAYEDQRHELARENDELKDTLKTFFTELGILRNIIYSKKEQRVYRTDIDDIGDNVLEMPFDYSSQGIREIGFRKLKEIRNLLVVEGYNLDHGVGEDEDENINLETNDPTPHSTPSQRLFGSGRIGRTGRGRTDRRKSSAKSSRSRTSPSVSPTSRLVDELSDDIKSRKKTQRKSKRGRSSLSPISSKKMCELLNISFSPEKEEELTASELRKKAKIIVDEYKNRESSMPRIEIYVRELFDLISEKIEDEEDREKGLDNLGKLYKRCLYHLNLLSHQHLLLGADLKYLSSTLLGIVGSAELVEQRLEYLSQQEEMFDSKLMEKLEKEEGNLRKNIEEKFEESFEMVMNADNEDHGI